MTGEVEGAVVIRRIGRPGDLGWVVQAHGELYAREFGFDSRFEAVVLEIMASFTRRDPEREAGWIAELNGRRVGCILCVRADDDDSGETAKLRVLLVHPDGRGHGIGGRLVDTCLAFARSVGYQRMKLWTTDQQVVAQKIYTDRGFALTGKRPNATLSATDLFYALDLTV
ncbi:GNAT family N-acetyltransferase [Kribbella sp. NBC_01245]|uniref:GNAT family N-acetyltransferase n=1 Tax=Kribbella sp. NBC_01245 TaxID=2903578 RepID=UPI002E2B967F|nr:GNAT family N-acetyltransferase [Kribbella sp. NBC_01245]